MKLLKLDLPLWVGVISVFCQSQDPKLATFETHDRAIPIKEGWIRDPYIFLDKDGFYYLTGTTPLPDDPQTKTAPYDIGLDAQTMEFFVTPSIIDSIGRWRSLYKGQRS